MEAAEERVTLPPWIDATMEVALPAVEVGLWT